MRRKDVKNTTVQGLYSPTIPKNILCLFSPIFSNSDWLNHTVCYIQMCYIQMLLKIEKKNSGELDKKTFHSMIGEYGPRSYSIIIIPTYQSYMYPFLKRQILNSSKLKEFADDNFKFDEYGGKFSIEVENTVGKGEIAHYEQFLLFPQCFQKICTADT